MRVWLVTASVMMAGMGAAQAANLTTLVSFTNTTGLYKGSDPQAGLIIDSLGNLYGTTLGGGTFGAGTVFKLAKGATNYTFSTLATFNNGTGIGSAPFGGLYADATGNLYGTTAYGGPTALSDGNVFKLTKSGSNYTLSTLAYFTGTGPGRNGNSPTGTLIADSSGNLFGTTNHGGTTGYGTAFELVKASGYAVSTLATFSDATGGNLFAGLIADSSGNLFGTTNSAGGANTYGTVFELVKASGYAITTLASFTNGNGANPYAGLISDSLGNLYGTTYDGGSTGFGTVFELIKASGYALSTLATFTSATGKNPDGGLIMDSAGNLFGTTDVGGSSNDGTVFELVKGASGYTLQTVSTFTGANGSTPYDGLVADSSGNLFGTTTLGGAGNNGTVFEVTNSGFVVATAVPEPPSWALLVAGLLGTAAWRRRKTPSLGRSTG